LARGVAEVEEVKSAVLAQRSESLSLPFEGVLEVASRTHVVDANCAWG